MDNVFSSYIAAIDELNILTAASYYAAADMDLSEKIKQVSEDFLSFLINAYSLGIQTASEMFSFGLTVDTDKLREAVFYLIDGKTFQDRVADHILSDNLSGLRTLAESEYHRVFNAAEEDGAKEFQENTGMGVIKTWLTVRDEKVRDTHDYLEGVSVPLGEDFYTYDDDHASRPGWFTKAENNVNCRCVLGFTIGAMQVTPA